MQREQGMGKQESDRERKARLSLESAEQAAELARSRLERAYNRMNNVANEPPQPKRGSMIKFHIQFQYDGPTYSYGAIRATDDKWYLTGKKDPLTWDSLLDFMYRDVTAKELGVGFMVWDGKTAHWAGRKQG